MLHALAFSLAGWGRWIRRALRSRTGTATVEFALLMLPLAAMALGAFDFGRWAMEEARLSSAVRAGAAYGVQDHSAAADADGMIAAARQDAGDSEGLIDLTARQFCQCSSGGEVSCSTNCADGAYPPMYVEVSATHSLTLLFPYPGIEETQSLSVSHSMRVR